jgi:purine-nucleoside phosphorylase
LYRAGVVLGSGLGSLADRVTDATALPYDAIPHFPRPSVAGHSGRMVLGLLAGVPAAVLQGRVHNYEGGGLESVTFPVRVLQRLGVPALVLTAAAGGIRSEWAPGTIVCLRDHLNLLGGSPLTGPHDERLGPRFPDMSEVYDPEFRRAAAAEASSRGWELPEAVYAALPGPQYETPAEIRMLRTLGAEVVGMSTVPEAIAARHGGLSVLAFALVTNAAAGILPQPLNHAEVLAAGETAGPRLGDLIEGVLARLFADKSAQRSQDSPR